MQAKNLVLKKYYWNSFFVTFFTLKEYTNFKQPYLSNAKEFPGEI